MSLFWASGDHGRDKAGRRRVRWKRSRRTMDEDDALPSLMQLCLFSLADNMKEVWMKDSADSYSFRHVMGPFNLLPGDLVEDLTCLLSNRKQLSRAALHFLLVPQLHNLSLERCPGLVTSAICAHIAARCQGLWSLDLSGAQQLPSKVLSATLCCLPALRSLSLAGTPCDRCVIRTITHHCPLLRHLDVSRCHFLSPASLLALVGGPFCLSSSGSSFCSTSTSQPPVASSFCPSSLSSSSFASPSPVPLTSLLALDIGFGEQKEEPAAAAAYLLLSLPGLKTVAMEGVAQACRLIEHREFSQTDEFSIREGVPRLVEVWSKRRHRQDRWMEKREGGTAAAGNEEYEEEKILWEGYCEDSDEDVSGEEGPSCTGNQVEEKRKGRVSSQSGDEQLILQLKNVKGVTCDLLDSLGNLCPHICSISVNVDHKTDTVARNQVSVLAAGLQTWPGQLQSLSLLYPGPLEDLPPALRVTGSSLVSLTLDGVKTSPHCPLLEVMEACPRLRELLIFAEPPSKPPAVQQEDVVGQWVSLGRPQLPNLCSLSINFSLCHSQIMPVMSWLSLRKVLKCLLVGSPLLERLSLVSLPCPLNCLLEDLLAVDNFHVSGSVWFADLCVYANLPLRHVRHVDLTWTDVKAVMVETLVRRCRRLKLVDVSHCWEISLDDLVTCKSLSDVKVVWVK
uniref:uncharacterized protein LOC122769203 n=1 Tax=Solea senegalensis TaxID=28829 RepID=UPI001CD89001|nr:uncharacterized protein LOC122769203 [Solea senegalensis]XP_043881479.1 uncharacterized protein LOC122769203 [Solea senegalensis]